jgi:hypothetical protein
MVIALCSVEMKVFITYREILFTYVLQNSFLYVTEYRQSAARISCRRRTLFVKVSHIWIFILNDIWNYTWLNMGQTSTFSEPFYVQRWNALHVSVQ